MEKEKMKKAIINTMSLVFELPSDDINDDSSIDTIANWDSLRHLNLILALEEEFGISIPIEEVGTMVNVKIIQLVIEETINNN